MQRPIPRIRRKARRPKLVAFIGPRQARKGQKSRRPFRRDVSFYVARTSDRLHAKSGLRSTLNLSARLERARARADYSRAASSAKDQQRLRSSSGLAAFSSTRSCAFFFLLRGNPSWGVPLGCLSRAGSSAYVQRVCGCCAWPNPVFDHALDRPFLQRISLSFAKQRCMCPAFRCQRHRRGMRRWSACNDAVKRALLAPPRADEFHDMR